MQRTPGEFSSRSDERDAPGDHWVTIDGRHVLIHESQGKQPAQPQPPTSVTVLGKNVKVSYDSTVSAEHKITAGRVISGAADFLNKNAEKLNDDEKEAIAEISSFEVTESPTKYLGATGGGR